MKKTIYILLFSLISAIALGLLTDGLLNSRVTTVPGVEPRSVSVLPTSTNVSFTGAPLPNYEILSPTKIKKDNVVFEASMHPLTCAELEFEINGSFPADYPFPSGNTNISIFREVEVTTTSHDISLKLDPSFGGGGGSDINGLNRGQGLAYTVSPPLYIGQRIHFTALVTFNESFGIAGPVPFEIDIVVKQC
jgi:hypothetical protein